MILLVVFEKHDFFNTLLGVNLKIVARIQRRLKCPILGHL
jgi:hypothetical protein